MRPGRRLRRQVARLHRRLEATQLLLEGHEIELPELRKAIRRTFGKHTPIQRCQIHKGRNIMERLPKHLHAPVRRTLRQAWEMDDAGKAEQLIRNLARRLEQEAPGVSETILEGIDEILTVVRLKLPPQLRRSLACTNIIEHSYGGENKTPGNPGIGAEGTESRSG